MERCDIEHEDESEKRERLEEISVPEHGLEYIKRKSLHHEGEETFFRIIQRLALVLH
jgi:hypothetical protein